MHGRNADVRVALPGSVSACGRWGGKLGWAATVSIA
jgi:hypothetical protein